MEALLSNNNNNMKGLISTPLYFLSSLPVFFLENYAEIIGTVCLAASTIYLVLNNRKGVKLKAAEIEKTNLESELLRIDIEKAKEED